MLKIEIVDEQCGEDEAYCHRVAVDTDKLALLTAISILYPNATSILFLLEE